jgi:hypothetical protein
MMVGVTGPAHIDSEDQEHFFLTFELQSIEVILVDFE